MMELGGFVIDGFKEGVKNIWERVKGFFTGTVDSIKVAFANIPSMFREKFSEAWENVKNVFSGVGDFFSGIWGTIRSKFTDIGQRIGDALGGAFRNALNSVFASVERVLAHPINAINSMIGMINNIPGVNMGPLSHIALPRLAQGGWVAANNPQLAIIGDNTREGEIVTPESKIYEQVAKAMRDFSGAAQAAKELTIRIIHQLPDGRQIIKVINDAQIEAGEILLVV
jgi:hypothetical protein